MACLRCLDGIVPVALLSGVIRVWWPVIIGRPAVVEQCRWHGRSVLPIVSERLNNGNNRGHHSAVTLSRMIQNINACSLTMLIRRNSAVIVPKHN